MTWTPSTREEWDDDLEGLIDITRFQTTQSKIIHESTLLKRFSSLIRDLEQTRGDLEGEESEIVRVLGILSRSEELTQEEEDLVKRVVEGRHGDSGVFVGETLVLTGDVLESLVSVLEEIKTCRLKKETSFSDLDCIPDI